MTQAGRLFASDAIIEGNITVKNLTTASGKVVITEAGQLVASDANIQGTITATSGKIGGFDIGSTYIESNGLKLSSGSIEYKKDKLQSNFGALYTGITGYEIGLYIKNIMPSTGVQRLCAYFESAVGTIEIGGNTAMLNISAISGKKAAVMNGVVEFKNKIYLDLASIPNISGASNYYLCINRSTGQLSYR